jgi:TPP-dependent pyruvate/acetoin dehydrogenase alpha subunit
MSKRAFAFDMHSIKVDGQDVVVYEKAPEALADVCSGDPVFLDVETFRMNGPRHRRSPVFIARMIAGGRPRMIRS